MPSATMATTVATGIRSPRRVGTPPIRSGSTVILVNGMPSGYAPAHRPCGTDALGSPGDTGARAGRLGPRGRRTCAGSGLRLADADHPADAEPVHAHAELVAPQLLLQGRRHGAAVGQLAPVTAHPSASSPLRLTVMLLPALYSSPGGLSAHMRVKPPSVSSKPCITWSACVWPCSPNSPNVRGSNVPPKTSL